MSLNTLPVQLISKYESMTSQYFLNALINSSNDAIISLSIDGVIVRWNPAAEEIFGYLENEMVGKHISLIIPPYKKEDEIQIIERILQGERISNYDTIRINKHGEEIPVSVTASPIKDHNQRIIGVSKISQNISERIKLEKKLIEHNTNMKKLLSQKDDFITLASHNFKTPITVILANIQLLEKRLHGHESHELVKRATIHVKKLNRVVSDMFELSKIISGKFQLIPSLIDLVEVLNQVIEKFQKNNMREHIIFETQLTSQLIMGDAFRVAQVMEILLANACKYSKASTNIIVQLREFENDLIVSVTDYGIGIHAEELGKIFNKFNRTDKTDSGERGLGIGLCIAQEIIYLHGGSLSAESEYGKGSTFYFTIPLNK